VKIRDLVRRGFGDDNLAGFLFRLKNPRPGESVVKLIDMKFALPKIYPITDVRLSKLSHLEQVRRLVEGGAQLVQLRDKHSSPEEFYRSALEVMEFARAEGVNIIINDRVDIALAVRADGVHLGQHDLPPVQARKILGQDALIGFSTHSTAQVLGAIDHPIDYLAIGPVFQTVSKENPDPVVGLEGVEKVRAAIGDFPLVAIGGIGFENAGDVLRSGADSVAVISALLKTSDDIAENYRKLLRALG
jgi:thiamine-phosphate pyrophosphorylase